MRKIHIILIIVAFAAFSCKTAEKAPIISIEKVPDTITMASGLKYIILKKGNGRKIQPSDVVSVHYTGKFLNDSVFDSSRQRNQPIVLTIGKGQVIKGWEEGLLQLSKGDDAILIIPPHLAYGDRQVGPIPPNSILKFEVYIVDVTEVRKPEPFNVAGKDTLTLSSGLKILIVEEGNGARPAFTRKVDVHYTGYFTDGRVFDSSIDRGRPLNFEVGAGRVIKGWDEGIMRIRKGGKARLIIPPYLAYGDRQTGPIPPNSTLIFDVELIDIE
jgi:peptidylprolyl isomerase